MDNLAAAVVAALAASADVVAGELFQVGTGRETTINELAAALGRAVRRDLDIRREPARLGDVLRNVAGVDKAADRLGYRAPVAIDYGLEQTGRWFETALEDRRLAAVMPHQASGSD